MNPEFIHAGLFCLTGFISCVMMLIVVKAMKVQVVNLK